MVQSRITASLIHLAISAVLLSALSLVVFLVWYPGAYFSLAGAIVPMQALVLVDLVIGPLLTLIVYKVGKPSLKFDLAVIALLQVAALVYGTWALAQQRPAFLVYESGVFHVVSAVDVNEPSVPDDINAIRNLTGATTVWAVPFQDKDRFLGVLMDGNADIYLLPEQYRPFEQGKKDLQAHGIVLDTAFLEDNAEMGDALMRAGVDTSSLGADGSDALRLFPVLGRSAEGVALVNVDTGVLEALFLGVVDAAKYRAPISPDSF